MSRRNEIEFTAGPARVAIDLDAGGRISELSIGALSLLVPRNANPLAWGCYPMAPWAGRVRNGRFQFAGELVELPLAMPPNAIHGTTYDACWEYDGGTCLSCDLGPDWPWPGQAIQEISLTENSLELRLEIRTEGEAFPATLGWHPWFRRQLERGDPAELSFEAESMFECDASGIPTGELVSVPPGPWDDCFLNVRPDPEIRWPGALSLRLESSANHWVVYSEPEHALCVEPMTGPPDALNSGAERVEPTRPLAATMKLEWRIET
jgi:aldose 1-epimerase